MKVILPMAGRGSRFAKADTNVPKPLIEVRDKPMLWWALQSVANIQYSELIVISLLEHEEKYSISNIFNQLGFKNVKHIFLEDVTDGQLCTVLAAKEHIDEEDILITSSDTFIVSDIHNHIMNKANQCKGIISVIQMEGDTWSFARTDKNNKVIEVAEKRRISNNASTGLYYFSNGHEFLSHADLIVSRGEKTKGEYYIMPVYQKYIDGKADIHISTASKMWDMGNPEALNIFLNNYS
jgi:UDP-N-acetylglucosamine diphosphorylase / glucose-1-phosphate thymidylyltransferase / UDP-N-acetylgalactosamine diphosphorylase / glucosamine-1-phosphate N-acetyltransferase / galactosamine-1-phosphate N-acetyltransferase